MAKLFGKKQEDNSIPQDAKVIKVKDVPLTDSGEPDIAAILAENGLGHIDLSKAKVIKTDNTDIQK